MAHVINMYIMPMARCLSCYVEVWGTLQQDSRQMGNKESEAALVGLKIAFCHFSSAPSCLLLWKSGSYIEWAWVIRVINHSNAAIRAYWFWVLAAWNRNGGICIRENAVAKKKPFGREGTGCVQRNVVISEVFLTMELGGFIGFSTDSYIGGYVAEL